MGLYKIFLLSVTAFVVLLGCARVAEVTKQETVRFVLKSPLFRFTGTAFAGYAKEGVKLDLYQSGKGVMRLFVTEDRVCADSFKCMRHKDFNVKFLGVDYQEPLLYSILLRKPIMGGKGLQQCCGGFTQTIATKGRYRIEYEALKKRRRFLDTINQILIKVETI